jgi:hypothetical protein
MTPKTKDRLSDLSRRARRLFDMISHARRDDTAMVDNLMVEINGEWRQICEEMEEMLEVYPHVLDALEMRFRREHRKEPSDHFRTEELIAFACTHRLDLNGERYVEP